MVMLILTFTTGNRVGSCAYYNFYFVSFSPFPNTIPYVPHDGRELGCLSVRYCVLHEYQSRVRNDSLRNTFGLETGFWRCHFDATLSDISRYFAE